MFRAARAAWGAGLKSSWAGGATRAGQAAQRSALVLESPDIGAVECRGTNKRINWRKKSSGAPLPGTPNVGSRVPAKTLRFEHWGAHEDLPLPNHALSLAAISRPSSTNPQHKRHEIYTGSGHRCGVIPYSSVVWWIASWAEDEQYKGKNSLLR